MDLKTAVKIIDSQDFGLEEEKIHFEQKFVMVEKDRFEIIEFSAHGDRVAVTVLIDTKLHYAIYKMPAMKKVLHD